MPRKPARPPVKITKEVEDTVLERLSNGESLLEIERTEGMPRAASVRYHLLRDKAFAEKYVIARNAGLDHLVESALDVATGRAGTGDVHRDRLIVDTIKWTACKLYPRRYSDSIRHEVDGGIDLRAAMKAAEARRLQRLRLEHGVTVDAPEDEDIT